jgi:hypothetical protein
LSLELGMCLMIRAMSITGGHADLVDTARLEAAHCVAPPMTSAR